MSVSDWTTIELYAFWHVTFKYTGLRIVYAPFWDVPLVVPSQWSTWRMEDEVKIENESTHIEYL